jgi:protein-disulfide isomerase
MKKFSILITFIVLSLLIGCTQNGAVKDDVEKLKEGQANIIKELGEVKTLLQAKTPPKAKAPPEFKEAVMNIGDDPFKGEKLAKVTIVEFTDYQ